MKMGRDAFSKYTIQLQEQYKNFKILHISIIYRIVSFVFLFILRFRTYFLSIFRLYFKFRKKFVVLLQSGQFSNLL